MDQEESPYAIDASKVVPPEHRMFLHTEDGRHYAYGCNKAYEVSSKFDCLNSEAIRFPFYASADSWHFFIAVDFGPFTIGVVNRSLYLFSELLAEKLCDTPVYRGHNPLIVSNGELLFCGQDAVYLFIFPACEFVLTEFPKVNSSFCFGNHYFDDLNQKLVHFASGEQIKCRELLFGRGNLALYASRHVTKAEKFTLVDLVEKKEYALDDDLLEGTSITFSYLIWKDMLIVEQAGLFLGFDDEFWYERECAAMIKSASEFDIWEAHFWAQNLWFIDKLEDQFNKISLYMHRTGRQCEVSEFRRRWADTLGLLRKEAHEVVGSHLADVE